MGIRCWCPNGHKLNIKAFQAGKRGICPYCGARFMIPTESTRKPGMGDRIPEPLEHSVYEGTVATPPMSSPPAESAPSPASPTEPMIPFLSAPTPFGPLPGGETAPLGSPSPGEGQAGPGGLVGQEGGGPLGSAPPVVPAISTGFEPFPREVERERPGVPDPLAEAPDAVWYVRPPTGGQFGPAPADVMRNWIAEGRVSPDSLVWREGWRDWQEAGHMFSELTAPLGFSPVQPSERQAVGTRPARKDSTSQNLWLLLLLVVVVAVLLGVFIYIAFGPSPTPSGSSPTQSAGSAPSGSSKGAPAASPQSAQKK